MALSGRSIALIGIGTAAGVYALDQASKSIVRERIPENADIRVGPGVRLSNIRNEGVAYGMLQGLSPWVSAAVAVGAVGGGAWLATRPGVPMLAVAGAALVAGGSAGNIVDRARTGGVTDFLRVGPAFGYFNVADIGVTVGMVCLGLAVAMKR